MRKFFKAISLLMAVIMCFMVLTSCNTTSKKGSVQFEYLFDKVDSESAEISQDEIKMAHEWFDENILCVKEGKAPAFSFTYNEKSLSASMEDWTADIAEGAEENGKKPYTVTLTHKTDSIIATCEAIKYMTYPTVEWTVYLKNAGADSKEFDDILALNGNYKINNEETTIRLQYNNGSPDKSDSFLPVIKELNSGDNRKHQGLYGRPSYSVMPFFNLDINDYGVITAIGWPGQWAADFKNVDGNTANIKIGQEVISGYIKKNEQIRTPLVAIQFYKDSVIKGQNIFRRWIIEYNSEHNQRQLLSTGSIEHEMTQKATTDNQMATLEKVAEYGIPAESFWMDAGWYPLPYGAWTTTGNWKPDPERWPDGMKDLNKKIKQTGMKQILWFEPERVVMGTPLFEMTEYLISTSPASNTRLWDFSNDAAAKYMCELINEQIRSIGIGVYRQDFNMDLLDYWRAKDTQLGENRPGFTENKYVVNYLKFWDYLLEQNPELIIDNCASGGRRLCLESTRRSIALLRSDLEKEPKAQQNHNAGLAYWLPYTGTGTIMRSLYSEALLGEESEFYNEEYLPEYLFRSCWSPIFCCFFGYEAYDEKKEEFDTYLEQINEYMDIREYYLKDYYPLYMVNTDECEATDSYIASQYHDPKDNSGMFDVVRRQRGEKEDVQIKLYGLNKSATYVITSMDDDFTAEVTGEKLMSVGIVIKTPSQGSYSMFTYKAK